MAGFSQQVYSDFSDGFNDSVAAISIKDSEVVLSENAEYSAEIKSFKTRKGSINVNENSFKNQVRVLDGEPLVASFTDPGTLVDDEYTFIYKSGSWYLGEIAVTLSNFGVSVYGTAKDGDKIHVLVEEGSATVTYANVEITDAHVWFIGSMYKKVVIINGKMYDYDQDTDSITEKIVLSTGATRIYPFVVYNKFYFGDGNELYVWGDYDFSSEQGTASVARYRIVRNNDNSTTGTLGHFYQAKNDRGSINLTTENYNNTTNWEDVTEVPYFASSVIRVLRAYDPSQPEVVNITVVSGSTASGTITIYLDGVATTVSITANSSVDTVVNAIKAASVSGWTSRKSGNTVVFTKDTNGLVENGYVDPGETGCIVTYVTQQEGKIDDNDLAPIRKCTMFVVHTASYRVFAAGNPDDNAVFYSEIGNPAYFKSDYNKVYGLNSYGRPTGMIQLSESVLVSFENGWYAWNGVNALEDATWKPLNLPYGCTCARSIALTPYSFLFLGRDGLYNVSASILNSEYVLLQGNTIITKVSGSRVDNAIASIDDMRMCQGFFHNNIYYLAYNTKAENGNERVLKFEWDTKAFTENTGWKVNAWCEDGDGFYFASTNYLMKTDVGDVDIDVETGEEKPIEFHIKTKEYHFGNPFMDKVVRLVGIIFKQPITTTDVDADIKIIMGYEHYDVNSVNITESLVWGRNWAHIWGYREAIAKMIELTRRSNTFQVDIQNKKLHHPLTIVAIGFIYEPTDFVIPTLLKDEVLLQ